MPLSHAPILLVDDEPQGLALLGHVLADERRLLFARSGSEALALTSQQQPALVLLDVGLPDLDGYSVCRRLKADPRTAAIPVIFVTACTTMGEQARGFEAGAVDYITKPVSPPLVRARVRAHLSLVRQTRLEQSYREAVLMLGEASRFRDTDTGLHVWRMGAYAAALARACGWDDADCALMELAAPMHDIGKLGIPDDILLKPGRLDEREWALMKTHARIGHDILARSDAPLFRLASQIALRHHERWDGRGYPDGLAGQDIPEAARIVALADVFDALTMKRPYKDAWPVERALGALRAEAGRHFEPRLVELFEASLPRMLAIRSQWQAREGATSLPA